MARNQPRLFERRRRGRHRLAFDRFAAHVRGELGSDPVLEHQLTELRGLEDRKDEMEADAESSPHTFATICRTAHDLRAELIARLATDRGADLFAALFADDDPAPVDPAP
jgi:hypothetical protein